MEELLRWSWVALSHREGQCFLLALEEVLPGQLCRSQGFIMSQSFQVKLLHLKTLVGKVYLWTQALTWKGLRLQGFECLELVLRERLFLALLSKEHS